MFPVGDVVEERGERALVVLREAAAGSSSSSTRGPVASTRPRPVGIHVRQGSAAPEVAAGEADGRAASACDRGFPLPPRTAT